MIDLITKNKSLDNYFMKPTSMSSNGLLLYPINIYDYEYFRELATKYITIDIQGRNNINRQDFLKKRKKGLIPRNEKFKRLPFDNLFDFLISEINKNSETISRIKELQQLSKEDLEQIKEIHKDDSMITQFIEIVETNNYENILEEIIILLGMITKKNVMFTGYSFLIYPNDKNYEIDKDNFYEFREIVMKQNLLFEKRIAPDEISQQKIDREFNKKTGGGELDLEAIVAFVSCKLQSDISNYTYYRLMADYSTLMRSMGYESVTIFKANGCKAKGDKEIEYPNLTEHLSIKDNPYARENIMKEGQITDFDRKLAGK